METTKFQTLGKDAMHKITGGGFWLVINGEWIWIDYIYGYDSPDNSN